MQVQNYSTKKADWIGILCSFGCAIHCAATPILLSILPSVSSVKWLADPLFHQVVAGICGVIVIRAIIPGFRIHSDWRVAALASSGVALLLIAAFVLPDECCAIPAKTAQSKPLVEKIVLLSADDKGTADKGTAPGFQKFHDHSGHNHANHSHANHNDSAEICEEECCAEPSPTWGRTLLTSHQIRIALSPKSADFFFFIQPFITPLGGLMLVLAHVLNIRMQCCSLHQSTQFWFFT